MDAGLPVNGQIIMEAHENGQMPGHGRSEPAPGADSLPSAKFINPQQDDVLHLFRGYQQVDLPALVWRTAIHECRHLRVTPSRLEGVHDRSSYRAAATVNGVAAAFGSFGMHALEYVAGLATLDFRQALMENFLCLLVGGLDASRGIHNDHRCGEAVEKSRQFHTHVVEEVVGTILADAMGNGALRLYP